MAAKVNICALIALGIITMVLLLVLCRNYNFSDQVRPVVSNARKDHASSYDEGSPVCDTCCYRLSGRTNGKFFIPLAEDELARQGCERRLPQAIIIGAKKSGTTALRTFLSFHPDVAAAAKEQNFFGAEDKYFEGPEYYKNSMPFSTKNQVTLEKTPTYYSLKKVPERVHKLLPHAKLIIILRNPVMRTVSDYYMVQRKTSNQTSLERRAPYTLFQGYKIFRTFEKSVLTKAGGKVNPRSKFVSISVYAHYLQHWLEVYPRDRLLAIDGDAFYRDPLPALQEVERFLEVRKFFHQSSFFAESYRGFPCLAQPVRMCLKASRRAPHPPIERGILEKLGSYFRPYNRQLVDLLNQTFTWSHL